MLRCIQPERPMFRANLAVISRFAKCKPRKFTNLNGILLRWICNMRPRWHGRGRWEAPQGRFANNWHIAVQYVLISLMSFRRTLLPFAKFVPTWRPTGLYWEPATEGYIRNVANSGCIMQPYIAQKLNVLTL